MNRPLAVLPMYDRAELRAETDRLWAALREALRGAGIAAPDGLDRGMALEDAWTDPGLALGQTCGLPFARHLIDRVGLIGAPEYRLDGCPPGHYRSAMVVRKADPRASLADFRGARPAVNNTGSQSGYAALMHAAQPFAEGGHFFGAALITGAHGASAEAVAQGEADLAALDAVAWRLMRRYDAFAGALRVLGWTEPTPGLPFITAADHPVDAVADAVAAGLARLAQADRDALGLHCLVRLTPADYAPLAGRLEAAEGRHRLPDV